MTGTHHILGDISPEQFLQEYWQKKPLLIRQALPGYQSPITEEELAGLATEDGVESRLVQELTATQSWRVEYGPFTDATFHGLPDSHWTLLVQHVDQWIPKVATLLDYFHFLPNWRIDDIMVGYAARQGSVGPHLDSYDVFLLQVQGKRRWMINETDYNEDDFIDGLELRVIDDFHTQKEWELQPGDMLYLPPGVAHHGIALEAGMTFSIGFRAPAGRELLNEFVLDMPDFPDPDTRFSDPDRLVQDFPGEIAAEDIARLHTLLRNSVADPETFTNWFGCYITRQTFEPGYSTEEDVSVRVFSASFIHCDQRSKRVFIRRGDTLALFVNGERYALPHTLLKMVDCITRGETLSGAVLEMLKDNQQATDLLEDLVRKGVLHCE